MCNCDGLVVFVHDPPPSVERHNPPDTPPAIKMFSLVTSWANARVRPPTLTGPRDVQAGFLNSTRFRSFFMESKASLVGNDLANSNSFVLIFLGILPVWGFLSLRNSNLARASGSSLLPIEDFSIDNKVFCSTFF